MNTDSVFFTYVYKLSIDLLSADDFPYLFAVT
jgi:hypothetical protein